MAFKAKTKPKEKGDPPVQKYRDGYITVSVWANEAEDRVFHSVTFERRYKKDENTWASSQSVPAYEIQTLRKLLDMAHTDILQAEAATREARKSE